MDDISYWRGLSGETYAFHYAPLPWPPAADQDGNYIFARYENGAWHPVYIGQGDLKQRYDAAMANPCVIAHRATHYHAHLNADQRLRLAEESDLIAGNPACLWPTGCNRQR